jgi:hypothetical protein
MSTSLPESPKCSRMPHPLALDEARMIIEKELDDFWHEELRELLFLLFYASVRIF